MINREARCAKSYLALYNIDRQIAEWFRGLGCKKCGGKLDACHYIRKPRGVPHGTPDSAFLRFSYCCRVDGCRKRALPPSTRFAGGCVYSAQVLACFLVLSFSGLLVFSRRILQVADASRRTAARYLQKVLSHPRESQFIRQNYCHFRTQRGSLIECGIYSSQVFSKYSLDFATVTLSAKLARSVVAQWPL